MIIFVLVFGIGIAWSGDSFFGPAISWEANGFGQNCVIPADVDDDGYPDLVVTDAVGSVKVLFNNGDAAFLEPVSYPIDGGSISVAAADFDDNGFLDLAVTSFMDNHVAVLFNNGDGTFPSATTYETGTGLWWVFAADR